VTDKTYLEKKHNKWLVSVEIPKNLRKAAGKARFKASLKTDSLAVANRVKHTYVAAFKQKIEEIRLGIGNPKAAVIVEAQEWRTILRAASTWPEDNPQGASEREILEAAIDQRADELDEPLRAVFRSNAIAKGVLLKDHYETWADEADVAGQTKSQHRSAVKRYLEWAGDTATIEQSNRLKAGAYVSHLLAFSGLSRRTIKRHLSSLSQLWGWFDSKGLGRTTGTLENVWLKHKLGKKPKTKIRTGLSDEQLLKLLNGRSTSEKYGAILHDLLRLGLLTGARLDELCALKKTDVQKREDGYWISITSGKTEAAVRDVPLHNLAAPIIERRLKGDDLYVFTGLQAGGPDEKRAWYVTKAYGRFRKQEGVGVSGPWEDFHALRHTFTDMMEGLEIPESTVQLIIGHARASMTYGLYSKGRRLELRKVIDQISYSARVMDAIDRTPI
jgi:integrase